MIRRPPRSTLFPYTTALPIYGVPVELPGPVGPAPQPVRQPVVQRVADGVGRAGPDAVVQVTAQVPELDRKSTRLNSSHLVISYAVFCLKKKTSAKQRSTDALH